MYTIVNKDKVLSQWEVFGKWSYKRVSLLHCMWVTSVVKICSNISVWMNTKCVVWTEGRMLSWQL